MAAKAILTARRWRKGVDDIWRDVLVACLATNAALGFAYRTFRFTRGGPLGDVIGQGVLALLLAGAAGAVVADVSWARWVALLYGVFFGVVVMPVWTLAVLIPLPPERMDYAFTAVYWLTLLGIVAGALAL